MAIEQLYHKQETAKEYTKKYTLESTDEMVVKQEDGMLGYISAGQFATTGSNIFDGGQIILGNLNIDGDIIANNFVTSSTLLFTGSTNHGSHIEDVHTYTGSVNITGSLSVIGGINGVINATNGVVSSSTQIKNYGDFATTGSNNFVGEIIITGSLLVSGSGTLRNIGSIITTGSLLVSGSTTQIGNNTLTGLTTLSGSIEVSGSQNFKGNQTLTGSFNISGSTTQIGNNNLTGNNTITGSNDILGNNTISGSNNIFGNTILSGSLFISGSQTRYGVTRNIGQWELTGSMYTSGSTYIVGNTTIGGNLDLTGSIRVSGSFTGSMQFDGDLNLASPHSFYRWGNKLFNYGNFYNTVSQSGSADTAYSVLLNTTDIAEGFSIVSGSRITATHTGVYNLQFSSQLYANDDVKTQFSFWLAYTGSNVANTQSEVTIPKEPNPGGSSIIALNLMTRMTAGDYVELMYSKTTTLGSIKYIAAGTGPTRPAAPSTIVTMTQVS